MQTDTINIEPIIANNKYDNPPYISSKVSSFEKSLSIKNLIKKPLKFAAACIIIENDKLLVL